METVWAKTSKIWAPPPSQTLSQWSDEHFYLSPEGSSTPGRWKTLPYQRGIMDAMTDPSVEIVTWMKSRRVGYTKILTANKAYHIAANPCSILHVQPRVEDAEGYSKDEIDALIRDVPAVGDVLGDGRSRDKRNTILKKTYPGGVLYLVGANSGGGFRRISVRIAEFDEVDGYPWVAGNDGDVITLGIGRTEDAWDRKIIIGSTPLIKGSSVVARYYAESDRRRFFVPCPHCDHGQVLKWGGLEKDYGFKWPEGQPSEVAYLCEHCHCMINHAQKFGMLDQGEWFAEKGRRFEGHAGFHIWAAYSYLPNSSWPKLAEEWLKSQKDNRRLQVFVNQILGEPWEERGKAPNELSLMARRERYPVRTIEPATPGDAEKVENVVPNAAAVLTSFTDVQVDRLETQVVGWGHGEEAWTLEYHVLHGDPTAEPVWQAVFELLTRPRYLERGGVEYIRSNAIDSGYASQSVYAYAAPRQVYRTPDGRLAFTWATKGVTGSGPVWPRKPGKSSMSNVPVWPVKVDTAKDTMSSRLQSIADPGPGFIHFPMDFGEDYFRQLTAEQAFDRHDSKGFPRRVWEMKKGRKRNEVWDTVVGNYAALCALYSVGFDLEAECEAISGRSTEAPPPARASGAGRDDQNEPSGGRLPRESGWLGERRGWLR